MNGIVSMASDNGKKGTGLQYNWSGDDVYDKLYKANPYVNMTYNKSAWQSFLGSLGFRTDYDRWLEEAQVNKNEYDAQVASIQMQNEYNSPSAEAARMRQAGLNPDLTGLENVAESASPNVDPQGMSPGAGESGEFGEITQKLWNFGTGILSLYQVGVGLAKDMLTFQQMKQGIANQDVDLAKNFMKFANEYVLNSAPETPFSTDDEYRRYMSNLNDKLLNKVPMQLKLNRRQRRVWESVVSDTWFNSEDMAKMTANWKESNKNLDELSKTKRHLYKRGIIHGDQWKSFNILSDELGDLANEVWKMQQKNIKDVSEAGSATAKYDKSLAEARNGYQNPNYPGLTGAQTQVSAEMAGYNLAYQTASVERKINSTMERIVYRLEQEANDGDLLASGLLLAMQIFRMSNFKFK